MSFKIDQKIVGYKVKSEETQATPEKTLEKMHEGFIRPETLRGITYKIKTPNTEHSVYVTINDVILNAGTENEEIRPFEIFLTSKDTSHFQWTAALTRIISAIFRKSGDVTFLVEELKSIFDPKGGYLKKGVFVPSLMADIGIVLEKHFKSIGLIKEEELNEVTKNILAEKREEAEARGVSGTLCDKCGAMAVVRLDGCDTCTSCGASKCG